MKRKMFIVFLILSCLLGLAQAEQLVDRSDLGGGLRALEDPYENGILFTTGDTPPTVTGLGFIDLDNDSPTVDPDGDGLLLSHRVTLWLWSDGSNVAEATVPAGDAGKLIDGFRYAALPGGSVTLAANTVYVVSTDTTGNTDPWLDQEAVTPDSYFVGTNDSSTWWYVYGTAGSMPPDSWNTGNYLGVVNLTNLPVGAAYDPVVEQTFDLGNADADVVFKWKAIKDPDGINEVDSALIRQDVYLSDNHTISADPNLWYLGTAASVPLNDANSIYPSTGHLDLDLDGTYDWAVVSVMKAGTPVPSPADPISDVTDPNNLISKWSFDALSSSPAFSTQPADILTETGQTVQFSVDVLSIDPESYLWKKSVDNANDTPGDDTNAGSTSDTLSFASAAIANEGYYYCAATNSNGTTNSDVAKLGVKRQLAHWTMDSPLVGGQYPDVSTEDPVADNIDPNVPGSVSFVAGPYAFGATSAISVDDNSIGSGATTLDPSGYSDQLTVTAWIRLTGTLTAEDGYGIVVKGTGDVLDAANYRWTFYARLNGSEPSVRLLSWNGGDAWTDANSIASGEWAHVTATVDDGGAAAVYVNGIQSGSTDSTFIFGDDAAGPIRIGNYGAGSVGAPNFPGEIDNVKIYNYGMTAEEVIDMYNAIPGPDDVWDCLYPELITNSAADANGDCRITLEDILGLVGKWLDCGRYPAGSCNW